MQSTTMQSSITVCRSKYKTLLRKHGLKGKAQKPKGKAQKSKGKAQKPKGKAQKPKTQKKYFFSKPFQKN
jgi:hypothetical protein